MLQRHRRDKPKTIVHRTIGHLRRSPQRSYSHGKAWQGASERMRNVFDQYSQPENRVTHALMTALHEDPALLRGFLTSFVPSAPRRLSTKFVVTVQSYPGELEGLDVEVEEPQRRGIPDAWITVKDEWCLIIENKVQAQPTRDQLNRHLGVAARLGFSQRTVLLLTVRPSFDALPDGVLVVEWRDVYKWLRRSKGEWAHRVADYLTVLEGKMVDREQLTSGTLTAFDGILFSDAHPYTYLEAKRLLRLISAELREEDKLKALLQSHVLHSRAAITGKRDDVIWDILSPEQDFSKCLHLTIGIGRADIDAMVTISNATGPRITRRLVMLGPEGFRNLVRKVLERMQPLLNRSGEGMEPRMVARQRRYPSIKATPFADATLDFDIRTIDGSSGPKKQVQWVDAIYGCLAEKNSNFSFQIGAVFPYRSCPAVRTPAILERMTEAWLACEPIISALGPTAMSSDVMHNRYGGTPMVEQ